MVIFKRPVAKRTGKGFVNFWNEPPQWWWDLALMWRVPGAVLIGFATHNTYLFYGANRAWDPDSSWTITDGKLLDIEKRYYKNIKVPRYLCRYEFEYNGKRYEGTRATTASPFRWWMEGTYTDVISESQYLQAIPILRKGERCSVWHHKASPTLSALAHDANSLENSMLLFLGFMPLIYGPQMKLQFWTHTIMRMKTKTRVRMPKWAMAEAQH